MVRWGILGPGSIANKFATGLKHLPEASLVAVGSRTQAKADAFADQYRILHRHGSYEDLANDPEVDVIYVATPHALHMECALLCLQAGKAVLCEKPFAINAPQVRALIDCARARRLFLMEGMWSRFFPVMYKVREWLAAGKIGDVRMLSADFGFRTGFNPEGRLFDLRLGGGALLDVGIYTVSFAAMVMGGRPSSIASLAEIGATGVDEQSAMVLAYPRGQLALLACAVRTSTSQSARIYGTTGYIDIPNFWHATTATLAINGKEPEHIEIPLEGNGFNYEAAEVMRCLQAGKLESDIMPLDESLAIMETLDAIRQQWGLRYPMEKS